QRGVLAEAPGAEPRRQPQPQRQRPQDRHAPRGGRVQQQVRAPAERGKAGEPWDAERRADELAEPPGHERGDQAVQRAPVAEDDLQEPGERAGRPAAQPRSLRPGLVHVGQQPDQRDGHRARQRRDEPATGHQPRDRDRAERRRDRVQGKRGVGRARQEQVAAPGHRPPSGKSTDRRRWAGPSRPSCAGTSGPGSIRFPYYAGAPGRHALTLALSQGGEGTRAVPLRTIGGLLERRPGGVIPRRTTRGLGRCAVLGSPGAPARGAPAQVPRSTRNESRGRAGEHRADVPPPRRAQRRRRRPHPRRPRLGTPCWTYDPSVADDRTRRTAQHYSARARGFDEHWAPLLRAMSRRVLPALPLRTARAVLDVGTGTGGMLPLAAEKGVGAHLVMGDAHALPLLSACADVVLLAFVLHRVADPAQALAETARCLRPGGRVATVTWGPGRFATPVGTLWHDEMARAGAGDGQRPAVDHHGLVDAPEKVAALMARAGLSLERAWSEAYSERRDVDATMAALTWDEDRLDALEPSARDALLRRVRERLEALDPDDLT